MTTAALFERWSKPPAAIETGAGRELAALGQALAQMQGVLANATEKFGTQGELFGTKIAEAATRLDRAVEFAAAGLGRGAEDAARRFDEQITTSSSALVGALDRAGDGFASKLDGVVIEIGHTLGPLGERLAGFHSTLEGLDERLRVLIPRGGARSGSPASEGGRAGACRVGRDRLTRAARSK